MTDITVPEVVAALEEALDQAWLEECAETTVWTAAVLGALARVGRAHEMCVDPPGWEDGGGRAGEHLWDLAISSWPRYGRPPYEFPRYFEAATLPRLALVAESEWGAANDPAYTGKAVLEDFSKILAARAPLKVMVFGYVPKGPRSAVNASHPALIELMKGLISRSDDDAVYILCGVSWRSERRPPIEVVLGPRNSAKGDARGA